MKFAKDWERHGVSEVMPETNKSLPKPMELAILSVSWEEAWTNMMILERRK